MALLSKPKRMVKPSTGRLSREDWTRSAMEALARGGLPALGVDALARRLKVTKGSFYWHFRDVDELLRETVRRWEDLSMDALLRQVSGAQGPCEAIRRVVAYTVDIETRERRLRLRVEVAAAALAEWHPLFRSAYVRVTRRRLDGLVDLYRATGLDDDAATRLGKMAYMTLIGVYPVLLAQAPLDDTERRTLAAELCRQLLPPECSKGQSST